MIAGWWNGRIIENFSGYYFEIAGAESGENGDSHSFFFLFGDMAHHILIFARVPASACALQKKRTRDVDVCFCFDVCVCSCSAVRNS